MTDDNNGNGGGELLPAPDTMVPAPKAGTVYGTWIMVWNSSTADWWKKEDIYGLQTVWPDGSWGAMDWNSEDYRMNTYDHLEKAGIIVFCNFCYGLYAVGFHSGFVVSAVVYFHCIA